MLISYNLSIYLTTTLPFYIATLSVRLVESYRMTKENISRWPEEVLRIFHIGEIIAPEMDW